MGPAAERSAGRDLLHRLLRPAAGAVPTPFRPGWDGAAALSLDAVRLLAHPRAAPPERPLCWLVFGGGFRVTGPALPGGTRPVPTFAAAFLVSNPATGAVLSSGAYAASP